MELLKDEIADFVKTKEQLFTQLNNENFELMTDNDVLFHLGIRRHHPTRDIENFRFSLQELINSNSEAYPRNANIGEELRNHKLLKFLIQKGNLVGYCQQFKHPLSMIKDPQNCCICLMHCIMRVSEKLMTLLLRESCKDNTNKDFKGFVKPQIQAIINGRLSNSKEFINSEPDRENNKTRCEVFFEKISLNEDIADDSGYDFQIKESDKSVDDFKISYSRMLKLLEVANDIIEASNLVEEKETLYKRIFTSWNLIIEHLFKKDAYSEDDIQSLWTEIIRFRDLFIDAFGGNSITNYVHIIISGHLIEMIRRFGNISNFSGIGFESLIGRTRSYIYKRTNHAGNNGGDEKSTHASNLLPFVFRRIARQLDSLSQHNSLYSDLYSVDNMKTVGSSMISKDRL